MFTLVVAFIGGTGCAAWLGLAVVALIGLADPDTKPLLDLASLISVGAVLVGLAFYVRLQETRTALLGFALTASFAVLNVLGAFYFFGPGLVVCPVESDPGPTAMISYVAQDPADLEPCYAPGPLTEYPRPAVVGVLASPTLLVMVLAASSAVRGRAWLLNAAMLAGLASLVGGAVASVIV